MNVKTGCGTDGALHSTNLEPPALHRGTVLRVRLHPHGAHHAAQTQTFTSQRDHYYWYWLHLLLVSKIFSAVYYLTQVTLMATLSDFTALMDLSDCL